jgi:hypothetical protein
MKQPLSVKDRFWWGAAGLLFGVPLGFTLAVAAAYLVNRLPSEAATVWLTAIVFGAIGAWRGPAVGDAVGMFLHGAYQASASEMLMYPEAPDRVYRPRDLAYLLLVLAVLAVLIELLSV